MSVRALSMYNVPYSRSPVVFNPHLIPARHISNFPQNTPRNALCVTSAIDPFDDIHVVPVPIAGSAHESHFVLVTPAHGALPPPIKVKLPRTRTASLDALVRQRTAQRVAAQDHELRLKAVAGMLLSRGNSAGRGARKMPPSPDAPRSYKRSRLSTMISVEDL